MKKLFIALFLTLGMDNTQTYADIGLTNEITYTNHSFTVVGGNTTSFPVNGEADITITVQNANTGVPANAVWVYLKFPNSQFWKMKTVITTPAGFTLLENLSSGNETILKYSNNVALAAPSGAPNLYKFVVRGTAIGSSEGYNGNGIFNSNFAVMEYANGTIIPGTAITQSAIQGVSKTASVKSTPLPVTLSSFSGSAQNGASYLTWHTATEKNNKGFDVERSADGKTFYFLGYQASLAPKGSSVENINYSFTDFQPLEGANYYRLKQSDFDGTSTYSNVVKIAFDQKDGLKIYPNPASNHIIVRAAGVSHIKVCTVLGQEVQVPINYGSALHEINTTTLASGNYTVLVSNGSETTSYKIVVQH